MLNCVTIDLPRFKIVVKDDTDDSDDSDKSIHAEKVSEVGTSSTSTKDDSSHHESPKENNESEVDYFIGV